MFLLFTRHRRTAQPMRPPRASGIGDEEDAGLGCGWFDSSHDLRQGLLATELPPDELLPAALALEICLAA